MISFYVYALKWFINMDSEARCMSNTTHTILCVYPQEVLYFDGETEKKVSCEVLRVLLFKQFMEGLFHRLFSNYENYCLDTRNIAIMNNCKFVVNVTPLQNLVHVNSFRFKKVLFT